MEKSRVIDAFVCPTFRDVIKRANENNLKKEDIIQIIKDNNQYYLIYEKDS